MVKSLNNYIIEKLKINKDSKLKVPHNNEELTEECVSIMKSIIEDEYKLKDEDYTINCKKDKINLYIDADINKWDEIFDKINDELYFNLKYTWKPFEDKSNNTYLKKASFFPNYQIN